MEQLIWFSVPGTITLAAGYLLCPNIGAAPPTVLVGAAPMLGFVIHQAYRTLFEACGGWESKRRPVLTLIQEAYHLQERPRHSAFMIWESTFYSNEIPNAFREHNRGMWHYVMSFRSTFFAAALSSVALLVPFVLRWPQKPAILWAVLFPVVGVTFWLQGRLTYRSLTRQEEAAFRIHRGGFDKIRSSLMLGTEPSAA